MNREAPQGDRKGRPYHIRCGASPIYDWMSDSASKPSKIQRRYLNMVSMTRYDPIREALTLRNAMDQLFSQSVVNPNWMGTSQSMVAPMDVCETDRGYEVNIALPGVRPEDIELTVQQNTLTVRGQYSYQNQHNTQHDGQQQGQHKNWLM